MAKVVFSGALSSDKIEVLSAYAQGLLTGVAEEVGLERITVTSTIRTPRAQAEAMYNNIASGRLIRYKEAGQKVTDLCIKMLGKLESKEKTISEMTKMIEELSEQDKRVSLHCVSAEEYAKCNIVDISASLVYDKAVRLLTKLAEREDVVQIIQPVTSKADINKGKVSFDAAEPAIHIEINIPEKYRV